MENKKGIIVGILLILLSVAGLGYLVTHAPPPSASSQPSKPTPVTLTACVVDNEKTWSEITQFTTRQTFIAHCPTIQWGDIQVSCTMTISDSDGRYNDPVLVGQNINIQRFDANTYQYHSINCIVG
jgi:hypothetical protein